jgi:hypothetical protein
VQTEHAGDAVKLEDPRIFGMLSALRTGDFTSAREVDGAGPSHRAAALKSGCLAFLRPVSS